MAIYRGPGGAGDATTDSSTEAAAAINAAAQAASSATNAASSATSASNSATTATTQATNAANSATAAAASASAASTSASNASTSATNAATSASTATTQANNASTSATSASTSASTAQSAATLATSKATDASNAASVATTKATEASTSASNAATSETNAAASASSASTSASTATTQASNAATSATAAAASASTATTKASEAATSATNAATSATNAANSATAAATSATNSANSATSSAGSASSAAAAQIAAETARDQTLAAYDNFDDRYLGTKASDPTLDNDGNALVAGALYFNSTDGSMKVYDGSVWLAAYASLSGALLAANNLSDLASASSARTNLGLGTAATTASTDYATAAQGTKADTAYGWGNHASAGYLLSSTAASTYQPLDADLTSIAGLSGTSGLLKKTAANTWSLDTTSYVSDTSLATTLDAYVLADNALAYYAPQAAPTFTGNVTLSSGTANGVAYLNGSKVLTTGSALTFDGTNLGVGTSTYNGRITVKNPSVSGNQVIFAIQGATSLSQLASWDLNQTSDVSTFGTDYAAPIAFKVNGSEQMRLTSTGLGIGTSSPSTKLDVNGSITVASTGAVQWGSGFVDYISGDAVNHRLQFYTANAERMRLDSSGNLGLGVTPSAWSGAKAVQIGDSAAVFGDGIFTDWTAGIAQNAYQTGANSWAYKAGTSAALYRQFYNQHQWYIAPSGTAGNAISFTQAMTLDASGNLGVGASSMTGSGNLFLGGAYAGLYYSNATGNMFIGSTTATPIAFGTNLTERMRIDSSGNLLVGCTDNTRTGSVGVRIGAASTAGNISSTKAASTNADDTFQVYSTGASAYRFYVDMGGVVHATNTTISAISDQRYKENIRDLDVGLDAVMALKPRKFDWKEGKGANIKNARGFIAQEFERVFPDLIDEWKDPAPEGEEPYKSVRQDLIPVLVKAIQELKAELDATKAEVAALKGK